MKKYLLLLLLLPSAVWAFQKPQPAPTKATPGNKVTLVCHFDGIPSNLDSVTLYEFLGLGSKTVARGARRASDSLFVITIPMSKPRFYAVGINESMVCKIILGEEPTVNLYANVPYIQKGRTSDSPTNKAYENVLKRIEQLRLEGEKYRSMYNQNQSSGGSTKDAVALFNKLGQAKSKFLDSLKTANPMLWHVATLYVTPDFTGQKGYTNEVDFYGKQFFTNADLAGDRGYDEIPDVSQAFESFYRYLSQLGANPDMIKKYAEEQLSKLTIGTRTHRMAFSGIINASKAANSQYYPTWAQQYIDQYRKNSFGEIQRLEYELKKSATFTPGFEAPELVGITPDSGSFALSKLRGKIVLIDFWASWCGPCRKENPNVKANYEKYKDKGFDILGVSLDREMGAWRGAIQQDGLLWNHISDLKGWQSQHAQLYSVTSIPQSILIDKQGKIIARNLRGEQLGEKLKEIFGE